jgi:DNA repair exonuclease SbcCD ATPase subunit
LPTLTPALASRHGATISRCNDMNQPWTKAMVLMVLVTLAVLTQSCNNDDLRKELRQANDEERQANGDLRQENKELREKVATIDKQLALLTERVDAAQRANQAASQDTIGNQIAAAAEAKKRRETDAGLRSDQIKQQTATLLKKIAAQMDRLLEEVPSLENSAQAWDLSMPKFTSCYKDASLQMNSLVAELDGLKFEHSEDVKLKIATFTNGYESLPGIGRLVVSNREQAAALRAAAKPSEADLNSAAGAEVTMAAQLSVFNTTMIECKKIRTALSQLAE